ncbi:MAG TPA: adenylate/guanylate cyclase domain-containing protein [Thermoanaerobaculia bacterium]|nr:adenylate/guanylate cyclase domain-containing protein [Thermoanaerobaculia bacterium]
MLRLRFSIEGQERTLPLSGARLRLGREVDNDIVLPDPSVSRQHAELVNRAGVWIVRDLQSTNGVLLNRAAVEEARLSAGDKLTVGTFEFFVEAPPAPPAEAPSSVLAALPDATIFRPISDYVADYGLGTRGAPGAPEGEARFAKTMFGSLARLARELITADSVDGVLERVIAVAFDTLSIDRGFLLLSDDDGQLACEIARFGDRVELRPTAEVPVSRTMLEAVMREKVALVTYDAMNDGRLAGGASILMHQIRAAMCAPLWSGERIVGVMQVDSPFQVGAFAERDLDFLTTLANFAAVAIESAKNVERAERERMLRSRLERYHSPGVIEEVLRAKEGEGGGRVRAAEASVLFADLVGFTAIAESSPPEEVARLLDAFLDLAVEAVFAAGGTLDKFIGDCVMAFFGAPVPQADHAERAVRAAIEIQHRLAAWNADRTNSEMPPLEVRAAVNSGVVVVGDIGSRRRVDYTVLGNTVNVAARLEAFVARPGDVVLGAETHRLLNGSIPTVPLGEIQLKGFRHKVEAFLVA